MSKSIIQEKSFVFAVQIVKFCRQLQKYKREFVLSNQVLRSGTSIGANVEEALGGQSGRDFIAKMSVAAKEARETHYWLKLLQEAGDSKDRQADELLRECREIVRVLNSIILTTRRKLSANPEPRTHNSELDAQRRLP